MAINTNIYGTSDSWNYPVAIDVTYRNYYNTNIELLSSFNAAPPKAADFGGSVDNYQGSFERGNTTGKTPLNSDIDNTIIAFGQHQNVSPFGRIEVVSVSHDGHTPLFNTEYISKSAPINTFYSFFYCPTNDAAYTRRHSWFNNKDLYNGYIWSPDATEENNINLKYYPIVSYGVKSMLNVPMVLVYNGEIGGAQNGLWVTLDQWRDSYSTWNCYGIGLYTRIVKTISANSITYTGFNEMFNDARYISSCVYDTIDDFTDYSFLINTQWGHTPSTILMIYNYWADSYNKTPESYRYYYPNMSAFNNCERVQYFDLLSQGGEILRVGYKLQYSLNNYNTIMKWAALFGLPFSPTTRVTFDTTFDDTDLYFPIIDDDGVLHGDYTHGSGNRTNPYNNISDIHDVNYDPTTPVDPNQYSNITSFNSLDTNAALTKFYVLDKTNVEKLGDDLWTICADLSVDDYTDFEGKVKDEFLTSNPIDSIISLKRFPFDVPHTFSNTKVNVKLGKSEGTAQGYRTYNVVFGVDFKGIDIYPRFGNSFLDYSPYTSYELYIPFCGTVEINPGDILGHKLNLQLRIDLFTGSVVAYIMADALVIGTANGNCALDQVLSGTQSATVYSNIINGILTYNSIQDTRSNTLGELLYPTGWIKGAISPFSYTERFDQLNIQEQKQEADLTHIIAPTHKMGTASPMLAWIQEFNARLMIYYPEGNVINSAKPPSFIKAALASFGHLKGFATVSPGKVSSFQKIGQQCYLRGDILADVIPCTDNERKRIRAALADGVFLPALTE